jgi:hypothetical protein
MSIEFENLFRSAALESDTGKQFDLLANLSREIQSDLKENAVDTLEKCVRLAAVRSEVKVTNSISELIDQVLFSVGLYPYMSEDAADWRRNGFKALYRDPINNEFIYHEEQSRALNLFISGADAILSAPTSFGKSALLDALITVKGFSRVAIVVPTLALLDEVKRRLQRRFSKNYIIISHPQHLDSLDQDDSVIIITTQERLLGIEIEFSFDLFVIDEFYKMDTTASGNHLPNHRAAALNRVFARYGATSKQMLLLGPTIDGIEEFNVRHRAFKKYSTDFRPVAINLFDRTNEKDPLAETKRILENCGSEPTLIYCASPTSANTLAAEIAGLASSPSPVIDFAEWIGDNIHPEWDVAKSLKCGVGIHHGRVPRSIASYQVKLFDSGHLPVLICTSTLIEGVNTSAKNIIIYDKTIDGRKGLNKFEKDNIKGRAGRLKKHFIGNVFVLRETKKTRSYDPDLPLLKGGVDIPRSMLPQMPDEALTSDERILREKIFDASDLPRWFVERWSHFGLNGLEGLVGAIKDRSFDEDIVWEGHANFRNMMASFDFLGEHVSLSKAGLSPKALAHFASQLEQATTLRDFMDYLLESAREKGYASNEKETSRAFYDYFGFLKSLEFSIPEALDLLEDALIVGDAGEGVGFEYYKTALRNYFLKKGVREMEEDGVLLPLLWRFPEVEDYRVKGSINTQQAIKLIEGSMSEYEQHLVNNLLEVG